MDSVFDAKPSKPRPVVNESLVIWRVDDPNLCVLSHQSLSIDIKVSNLISQGVQSHTRVWSFRLLSRALRCVDGYFVGVVSE